MFKNCLIPPTAGKRSISRLTEQSLTQRREEMREPLHGAEGNTREPLHDAEGKRLQKIRHPVQDALEIYSD